MKDEEFTLQNPSFRYGANTMGDDAPWNRNSQPGLRHISDPGSGTPGKSINGPSNFDYFLWFMFVSVLLATAAKFVFSLFCQAYRFLSWMFF